jgi:hypothetical protein
MIPDQNNESSTTVFWLSGLCSGKDALIMCCERRTEDIIHCCEQVKELDKPITTSHTPDQNNESSTTVF